MFDGVSVDIVLRHVVKVRFKGVQGDRVGVDGSSMRRGDDDEDTIGNVEVKCVC